MERREKIRRVLFGPGVNSKNRLERLLELSAAEQPDVFWPVFFDAWPMCDDTWRLRKSLVKRLKAAAGAARMGILHLPELESFFYSGLPDKVTIYRGCSLKRLRGLSWTTDLAVAAGFALGHRGIATPSPVVAQAVVSKVELLCVHTGRQESEVLIDPASIAATRLVFLEAATVSRRLAARARQGDETARRVRQRIRERFQIG